MLQGHRGTARHMATSQALNRGRCSFSLPGWWGQCLPLGGVFPPGGTPKALPSHNKEGKTSYMMKDASIRALLSTPASTSSGARSSTGQQSKAEPQSTIPQRWSSGRSCRGVREGERARGQVHPPEAPPQGSPGAALPHPEL